MKMSLKSFTAGILVGSIGLTTVFAAPVSKAINAVYSINAVTVDGSNVSFTEANQPFTVDGTTYLPVRAVAEALDKNVDYDSATGTVIITSKGGGDNTTTTAPTPTPSQEADVLTADMVSGYTKNSGGQGIQKVYNWDTNTKDNTGNLHTSGIGITTNGINVAYNNPVLDIALLGRYSNFTGQLVLTEASKSFAGELAITILADDIEVETYYFEPGTLPQNININVSNVQKLSFKFTQTQQRGVMAINYVYFGLVDVTLS